jgi:uroporphyrin-III C-methyltransferase / precorrin-2 dehydrogenase / sirohydrochlorin ferrochelatase
LMHGADPLTPVTVMENVSRADQRVLATTLSRLEPTLTEANLTGPAIVFLGLAPRDAVTVAQTLPPQEIAL